MGLAKNDNSRINGKHRQILNITPALLPGKPNTRSGNYRCEFATYAHHITETYAT